MWRPWFPTWSWRKSETGGNWRSSCKWKTMKMSSLNTFLSSCEKLSDQGLKARLSIPVNLDATVNILSVLCKGLASPPLVLNLAATIPSASRELHRRLEDRPETLQQPYASFTLRCTGSVWIDRHSSPHVKNSRSKFWGNILVRGPWFWDERHHSRLSIR